MYIKNSLKPLFKCQLFCKKELFGDELAVASTCGHIFHFDCFKKHLEKNCHCPTCFNECNVNNLIKINFIDIINEPFASYSKTFFDELKNKGVSSDNLDSRENIFRFEKTSYENKYNLIKNLLLSMVSDSSKMMDQKNKDKLMDIELSVTNKEIEILKKIIFELETKNKNEKGVQNGMTKELNIFQRDKQMMNENKKMESSDSEITRLKMMLENERNEKYKFIEKIKDYLYDNKNENCKEQIIEQMRLNKSDEEITKMLKKDIKKLNESIVNIKNEFNLKYEKLESFYKEDIENLKFKIKNQKNGLLDSVAFHVSSIDEKSNVLSDDSKKKCEIKSLKNKNVGKIKNKNVRKLENKIKKLKKIVDKKDNEIKKITIKECEVYDNEMKKEMNTTNSLQKRNEIINTKIIEKEEKKITSNDEKCGKSFFKIPNFFNIYVNIILISMLAVGVYIYLSPVRQILTRTLMLPNCAIDLDKKQIWLYKDMINRLHDEYGILHLRIFSLKNID
uniref:RING-type domain-containing protein n=1 Tax=Parastrongyloides trichosuri TaxID=131310 RepID=A0A0N4ZUE5_PARTI